MPYLPEKPTTMIFTVLLLCAGVWAQEAEPVRLVDSPTAGLTSKGRFGIDLRLFANGGVIGEVNAGILKRIAIGLRSAARRSSATTPSPGIPG